MTLILLMWRYLLIILGLYAIASLARIMLQVRYLQLGKMEIPYEKVNIYGCYGLGATMGCATGKRGAF
jgi:hypothetical protein